MSFLTDFEKTTPKQEEVKQEQGPTNAVTLQDMKDYFNSMRESMLSDLKKEIASMQVGNEKDLETQAQEEKPKEE